MKSHRKHPLFRPRSVRNELILSVFLIMTATSVFTVPIYLLLSLIFPLIISYSVQSLIAGLCACILLGTLLSVVVSRRIYRPLNDMIDATQKIAKGDFKVQIPESFDEKSDFGKLQRSFNHMASELDGIEMFRNDFINNFSHEFKTPIVSVRGFARQLQTGGLTEAEQREYIDIIASESDRLTKMATNVLLLSKLENQQIVTDKTVFDLDEQIRRCLLLLEKEWTAKNLELDIDLDPVTYYFNEDMLSHVWINLLGNAIKFTPTGGMLKCTLRQTDTAAVVTVTDTGAGMPPEVVEHIFEKFYQGDQSHACEGNGIGLTIVSRILVLCAGQIRVESTLSEGSTFTVTLPLTTPTVSSIHP